MALDESKIKELKSFIEARIAELKRELEMLEYLLSLLESEALAVRRRVSRLAPRPGEQVYPVVTEDKEHIADIYVGTSEVRIVPLVPLSINISPFKQFLISRVLEAMRRKDEELVNRGLLDPERALNYVLETDGEMLRELRVVNVHDERRKVEIRSAARWTLLRMYDKVKRGL